MKRIISFLLLIWAAYAAQGQPAKEGVLNLIIGTYTGPANKDGIYVYAFDTVTGDFTFKAKTSGVENPSYLDVSHDGKYIYTVNEVRDGGGVSSFDFNPESGELKFLNRVSSGGNGPAYISVDEKNRYILVANYNSGSLSAVALKADGSFSPGIQSFQNEGSSINPTRQKGPHVHCSILSPDNKFLLATDLGTDRVYIYHFDHTKTSAPLVPADSAFFSVKPGSGPRHIVFHPDSKYAFLITELDGSVMSFKFRNGKFSEIQTISMLAEGFNRKAGGADIHISPDGKFLYASNRGDANEIVIFSIGKKGKLNIIDRQSTLGKAPRNFVIDPSGNFLLVGNQESDEVVIFRRDKKTGLLTTVGKKIHVIKPVCLKFTN